MDRLSQPRLRGRAADIDEAVRIHTAVAGARPLGLLPGPHSVNTLRIGAEEGGFLYLADTYADELPYWQRIAGRQQLIVPYTLDANDMRFRDAAGVQQRRPVLQLSEGHVRRALSRGRRGAGRR